MVPPQNQHYPYMSSTNIEETLPLKKRYRTSPRGAGDVAGKKEYHRRKQRTSLNSTEASRKKFQKAFKSALIARTRFLGRRLTRTEWQALKRSVRKSCDPRPTDTLSRFINDVSARLKRAERLIPVELSSVEDSLELFRLQLSVLRQQALDLMQERDSLSETCPHFRHRTIFMAPSLNEVLYFEKLGSANAFSYAPRGQTEQLCCQPCLESRRDAYFSWYGYEPSFKDFTDSHVLLENKHARRLLAVDPLSIQSIWTSLISKRYRAEFKE